MCLRIEQARDANAGRYRWGQKRTTCAFKVTCGNSRVDRQGREVQGVACAGVADDLVEEGEAGELNAGYVGGGPGGGIACC